MITERSCHEDRVFAVSRGAAEVGIEPGMALRLAEMLCPQAHFISAVPTRYQRAFGEVLEALGTLSPTIEVVSVSPAATVYLDLADQKNQEQVEVAQAIGRAVRQGVCLAPALGLARGKFTTHVAAVSSEPNSALLIAPGSEKDFLSSFPVDVLPLDEQVARRLKLLGILTLGQLAKLSAGAVQTQFGKQGQLLYRLARGQDNRPLMPYSPRLAERVNRQLDGPVGDRHVLELVLQGMVVGLAKCLQAKGLVGQSLRLVLHVEEGAGYEGQLVMRRPSSDRARLGQVVTDLLGHAQIHSGVVELEVICEGLVPAVGHQLDLFTHGSGQRNLLHDALKDLKNRYGSRCFYQISLIDPESPLPELRFQLTEMDAL